MKNMCKSLLLLLLCDVAYATGYKLQVLPQFKSVLPVKEQVLQGVSRDLSRSVFRFIPNYEVVARVTPTVEDMSGEKSMYSATPEFASEHGGAITRAILDQIPLWYYEAATKLDLYPNIDVRVHDLDLNAIPPGFALFPAIPGVHADGEFRETYFSQPDLSRIPVSFHIVATVSTQSRGVSNTRFIDTPMQLTTREDLPDTALWAAVHRFVEGLESYEVTDMQDGGLVMFDARTLHQAMPARQSGKRLFFRMSMWHKPNLGDGQLSKQEQLYLLPQLGFKEDAVDFTAASLPPPEIVGRFIGNARISQLAEEQSIFGATVAEINASGGDISKKLVAQIPIDFAPPGYVPIVDMLVLRLYPGYRPFFPDYNGRPQTVNWHVPTLEGNYDGALISSPSVLHGNQTTDAGYPARRQRKELWMSVSSDEKGVNNTEFSGGVQLQDGIVLQTSAAIPRRELPAQNRGWRLLMRVRVVPENQIKPSHLLTQQYVDPASEETGW